MRRSMSALGGALIALTLAAGPAWAGSPGQQSVTHSAGAVQIEPIHVSAPVRVASEGQDAPGHARPEAGGQSARSSAGTVQVGSVTTDTPVRVLSDGDDSARVGHRLGSGTQDAADSAGVVQVGSVGGGAPVSVLSDGDRTARSTETGGDRSAEHSAGVVQVGDAQPGRSGRRAG